MVDRMPRVIIMRGGLHHRFYDLQGPRTRIGAHPDNDIVVENDPDVSRWHCTISESKGAWSVRDKGSRTGTFVNGTNVTETALRVGDRMRVGQTVVLFVPAAPGGKEDDQTARRLSNLLILQEINKELNSETDLSVLLELIMDTAIHLIQADRGFLILVRDQQLEFKVARNIDYGVVQSPEFKISNSVIRRVVKTGEPVLTSNAQFDLRDLKSIAALELRSLLCAPLRAKGKVIGTLYLDSQSQHGQFDDEGRDLIMAFGDQAAIAIENARLLREAKEKESILSELRVASRIQVALLPRHDPEVPGLEISGRMKTAQQVGGDYFDYIWGPQVSGSRNLYVAIGDVSGKGVPAGLVMVMARSVLRSLVGRGGLPRAVLRETNAILKQDLKPGMFMSLLLSYLDVSTGRLLLAGCGHERPLVYRAADRSVEKVDTGGLVLGVVSDIGPHIEEKRLALGPGDQILFYTDGVTEAVDPQSVQFGIERLTAVLSAQGHLPPAQLVAAVLAEIDAHARGAEQHDDITLIAVRKTA
jgi:serine phosphatase RsbU (regulator of sigma subunit)/pSer/pThr/pTyr-binding forkhead associated (FHA) protein